MKYKNNINGVLVVNKPKGLTSRDVVNIIQKKLNTKAGHTGTLDPLAEGVLVVCLGKATKLTEILTSEIKEYRAEATLGIETDTLDILGKETKKVNKIVSENDIKIILNDFVKTYKQEVPIYSAVKVKGKKLYEYARNNEKIELPKKEVTVYEQKLLNVKDNTFTFYTKVSKGTYIRSLIRDMCYALGTVGLMSKLTRISQGKFGLENAYTLADIEQGNYKIIRIKDALDIKKVRVNEELKQKIINGQALSLDYDLVLFLDEYGQEIAIYKKEKGKLRVWKMLV